MEKRSKGPGENGEDSVAQDGEDYFAWADQTEYEGKPVPLRIIRRMMTKDRLDWAEWNGQSITLSDEAWRVLTLWQEKRGKVKEGRKGMLWPIGNFLDGANLTQKMHDLALGGKQELSIASDVST